VSLHRGKEEWNVIYEAETGGGEISITATPLIQTPTICHAGGLRGFV